MDKNWKFGLALILVIMATSIIGQTSQSDPEPRIISTSYPLYNYEAVNVDYRAYWKSTPSTAETFLFIRNNTKITLQPMTLNYRNQLNQLQQINTVQSSTAQVDNTSVVFANIFGANTQLEYYVIFDKVKEYLVLNQELISPASYILTGGNVTLDMDFLFTTNASKIFINGLEWDKATTENTYTDITVTDSTGRELYRFLRPYAYDSNGSTSYGTYQVKKSGNNLYIIQRISYSWLDTAVYPVYIDPSVKVKTEIYSCDSGRIKDEWVYKETINFVTRPQLAKRYCGVTDETYWCLENQTSNAKTCTKEDLLTYEKGNFKLGRNDELSVIQTPKFSIEVKDIVIMEDVTDNRLKYTIHYSGDQYQNGFYYTDVKTPFPVTQINNYEYTDGTGNYLRFEKIEEKTGQVICGTYVDTGYICDDIYNLSTKTEQVDSNTIRVFSRYELYDPSVTFGTDACVSHTCINMTTYYGNVTFNVSNAWANDTIVYFPFDHWVIT